MRSRFPSVFRSMNGSGLGLAISKKMVEQLGGRLSVSSEPGQGSEFSFIITVQMEDAAGSGQDQRPAEESPPALNLHILLVEDNQLNQRIITKMLGKMGCQVDLAENGHEALEQLKYMLPEADQPYYDLIFMDIQMPVLDGLKTTSMIRAQEGEGARLDDYLSKPVRREDLRAAIEQHC